MKAAESVIAYFGKCPTGEPTLQITVDNQSIVPTMHIVKRMPLRQETIFKICSAIEQYEQRYAEYRRERKCKQRLDAKKK